MEIRNQIQEVLDKHKGLVFEFETNTLNGELCLPDGDSYNVRIDLTSYPRQFPAVYEIEGRIPIKMDRHMYPESGSCCFTTEAKSQILLKTKITSLLKFIDEIVVRYFENNSFFEINREYFGEEYAHGENGIIEGYKDILKIDNTLKTAKAIIQAASSKLLKEHQNCYCGSGRRLRKCTNRKHINNLRNLFLVDKEVLRSDLAYFREEIDKFLARKKHL